MWLSENQEDLSERYDAIIVGSGYGGAVAASRLARLGLQVCLLERGREILPGQYPDNTEQFLEAIQMGTSSGSRGSPTALFDVRCHRDINVLTGCGLGGTSLIDAGVCLRPDRDILQDAIWPDAIQNDQRMPHFYEKAEGMLAPSIYPIGFPLPSKFHRIGQAVQETTVGSKTSRPPLLINFDSLPNRRNAAGVLQEPCVLCGNCMTGCNYGAKSTLLTNYLPDAKRHGAKLFTQIEVLSIQQDGALWRVLIKRITPQKQKEKTLILRSDRVILSAGTLGTTEILLRSQEKGLRLSNALGHRFSGNGNMIGVIFNTNYPMNGVGLNAHTPPIGPCTTGQIDLRLGQALQNNITLTDLAFPEAISKWLPQLLSALAKTHQTGTESLQKRLQEETRIIQSKIRGSSVGAVHNTAALFATAHDGSGGRIIMEKDRIKILWPGISRQPEFYRTNEMLQKIAEQLGGAYLQNPIWNDLLGHGRISWNPLGGAVMADDAKAGVVNHKGQVFSSDCGSEVYSGLYVMDGSVIPRSLGVGPLLTICALSERSCEQIQMERK
ncbi:MAG: GMC family oxidoreductase [Nitrospirota bacterium]